MKLIDLTRLFLLAALWGGSYLFIRIAAPVLGVFFTISLRIILAAFALGLSGAIASSFKHKSRWQSYLLTRSSILLLPIAFATFPKTLPSLEVIFAVVVLAIACTAVIQNIKNNCDRASAFTMTNLSESI